MSLETNKSISLTGKSMINGTQVAYLAATIDKQGNGSDNVSRSIQNQALYDANKKEVRADIAAFQQLLYDTEDSLTSEKEGTDSSKTSGN